MKIQTLLTGLAATAIIMSVSACRTDNEQMIKRAQLAGYENLRLKKEIEQKDVKYDKIVKQKDTEIAELKQQIEQTQQKIRNIQEQYDKATSLAKQTDGENLRLKDLSLQKDAEIVKLKQMVNVMQEENMRSQQMQLVIQLTESLAECQQKLAKYEPVEALPVIPFSVADANEPTQQK